MLHSKANYGMCPFTLNISLIWQFHHRKTSLKSSTGMSDYRVLTNDILTRTKKIQITKSSKTCCIQCHVSSMLFPKEWGVRVGVGVGGSLCRIINYSRFSRIIRRENCYNFTEDKPIILKMIQLYPTHLPRINGSIVTMRSCRTGICVFSSYV